MIGQYTINIPENFRCSRFSEFDSNSVLPSACSKECMLDYTETIEMTIPHKDKCLFRVFV